MSIGNPSGMTFDLHSLDALKAQATKDPKSAIKSAARQLETLFMQELMKNMRASTLSSGMLENSGTKMGTELLDTEFAGRMSGLPNGLSAAIERQLSRQVGGVSPNATTNVKAGLTTTALHALTPSTLSLGALSSTSSAATSQDGSFVSRLDLLRSLSHLLGLGDEAAESQAALPTDLSTTPPATPPAGLPVASLPQAALAPAAAANAASSSAADTLPARLRPAEAFVRRHEAAAKAIEAETGIPAANLIGQAAHETGWGRHEIKNKDGTPSHNLFGIKAGPGWTGKVAEVTTTEYVGGVAHRVTARFRSYDSYEESFRDHARLLTSNPRYSGVVAHAATAQGYAQNLQRAGYATDPAYASKLTQVINTALRVQRTLT